MIAFFKNGWWLLLGLCTGSGMQAQCLMIHADTRSYREQEPRLLQYGIDSLQVPVFWVWPAAKRPDSAAIAGSIHSRRVALVFNDALFKQTALPGDAPAIARFDPKGRWQWNRDIGTIDTAFFRDSLQAIRPGRKPGMTGTKYRETYDYHFNIGLGSIRITDKDGAPVASIQPGDFPFGRLMEKLPEQERLMMEHTGLDLNTTAKNYSPRYTWYDIADDGYLYLLFQYGTLRDTIEYKGIDRQCIVQLSPEGVLMDVYPHTDDPAHTFHDQRMAVKDSKSLFLITHDYYNGYETLAKTMDTIPFISEFVLRDGRYTYARTLPFDLPKIHKEKYFASLLCFNYSHYPIAAFPVCNTLYNLETGKTAFVMDNELYNQSVNWEEVYDHGPSNERFYLASEATRAPHDHVYIAYRFDNAYRLQVYDYELRLISSASLPHFGDFVNDAFIELDLYREVIYFWDGYTGTYLGLPLQLFL